MPEQLFGLTAAQVKRIDDALGIVEQLRRNVVRTEEEEYVGQSPETYIIKTPTDGIPAMDTSASGGPKPGCAKCTVYFPKHSSIISEAGTASDCNDPRTLVQHTIQATVHNVGEEIDGDIWWLATREKSGRYIALPQLGVGTGTGTGVEDSPSMIKLAACVEVVETTISAGEGIKFVETENGIIIEADSGTGTGTETEVESFTVLTGVNVSYNKIPVNNSELIEIVGCEGAAVDGCECPSGTGTSISGTGTTTTYECLCSFGNAYILDHVLNINVDGTDYDMTAIITGPSGTRWSTGYVVDVNGCNLKFEWNCATSSNFVTLEVFCQNGGSDELLTSSSQSMTLHSCDPFEYSRVDFGIPGNENCDCNPGFTNVDVTITEKS